MTTAELYDPIQDPFALAWEELLAAEAAVREAVAQRDGAQRRYERLLREKRDLP